MHVTVTGVQSSNGQKKKNQNVKRTIEQRKYGMTTSWSCTTSISPSSSIIMLMMTTLLTPLTLTANYTEASDLVGNTTKNITAEEEKYTPYSERPETYFVPIIFLLILLIGLVGNSVLALMILRHTNMRNVPNMYVLSLALGDLLVRNIYICKYIHLCTNSFLQEIM